MIDDDQRFFRIYIYKGSPQDFRGRRPFNYNNKCNKKKIHRDLQNSSKYCFLNQSNSEIDIY